MGVCMNDMLGLCVLNIDLFVFMVDDFLSVNECDMLMASAEASGGLKVSVIGGAANENIRMLRMVVLNLYGLENYVMKKVILSCVEYLLFVVEGLSKDVDVFRAFEVGEGKWSFELS